MKKTLEKSFILFVFLLLPAFTSCGSKDENEFVDDRPPVYKTETGQDHISEEKKMQEDTNRHRLEPERIRANTVVISPLEAVNYLGKEVTVKGFIADIYKTERVAYLNFVEKYPDNPFTAVIFESRFENFGDIDVYLNKKVEVTGRVSVFREKPQMILDSPSQIRIVE